MIRAADLLVPDWPLPTGVKALITTRQGGVSRGGYASLNLGLHVGDDAVSVEENRRRVRALLPAEPLWLNQIHGARVFTIGEQAHDGVPPTADAATARQRARPCAILVADCLPVLLCDDTGSCVAAAHAGWRGLSAGVIERTVEAMQVAPRTVRAYLGPAIGPAAFEVGRDVVDAFTARGREAQHAFRAIPGRAGKYLADIYELARQRLAAAGVERVHGGGLCTVTAPDRFFSYRRDGITGRLAAIIWRE